MYEYKVEPYRVKESAAAMNAHAKEGWRVIAVTPNEALGYGLIVTYERRLPEQAAPDKPEPDKADKADQS